MTATIDFYKYAQLATASYVDLSQESNLSDEVQLANIANAQQRLPQGLADQFFSLTSGWKVAGDPRHPAPGGGMLHDDPASGFAATLFQNAASGEKVLVIRGTDPGRDGQLIQDLVKADLLHIGLSGVAYAQLVSLFNLVQRLKAPAGQTNVLQLSIRDGGVPPDPVYAIPFVTSTPHGAVTYYRWLEPRFDGVGQGVLGQTDSVVAVGHSLGGHLAAIACRLFPELFGSAVIFNAPGYDPITSSELTGAYLNLFLPFGANPAAGFSNITSLISEDTVPGNDVAIVPSSLTGTRYGSDILVKTELNSHVIEPIMDSLAPEALMSSLNQDLSLAQIGRILEAATATSTRSDEELLSKLYFALKGEKHAMETFSPTLTSAGSIGPRRAYYETLIELEEIIKANPALRLESFADRRPTAEEGKSDIAVRFAMRELSPFALRSLDYQSLQNANGELDLYSVSNDKGLTDKWFEARVRFHDTLVRYNIADGNISPNDIGAYFEDQRLEIKIGSPDGRYARYLFGKDGAASTLVGFNQDDFFFGGTGDETITANGGKDYIEGGAGTDAIDGGDGEDEICGQAGVDAIDGGADADKIYGGLDGDTIRGGKGGDTIYGDVKEDPENFLIVGDDTIHGGDGVDTIYGGAGKDTIFGDAEGDKLFGNEGIDTIYGGDGADTIEGGEDGDIIYGGSGAADTAKFGNTLTGNAGDDKLYGDGGADTIDGGADNDTLVGNFGADRLTGGGEDDKLYGDIEDADAPLGDNDQLDGGGGNDELFGGGGRDVLLGGEGDDKLRGGKGAADYMVGGAGFDTYFYRKDDQADLILDERGEGKVIFEGQTLKGGENKQKGERVWYSNKDTAEFTYQTDGDIEAGSVTLKITSEVYGGQLTVFNFSNGDLGIDLDDGNDPTPKKPPKPLRNPGNQNRGDPLVLDMGSVGISTYGLGQDLYFDLDGDGFAENSGWAGPQEGTLVYDKNLDGILNDGQELFGDFTRLAGGQLAANGFQALSAYDANHDGVIDALDPVWSSLRVGMWEADPFGNLILGDPATAMSLKGLDALGITSISVGSSIIPGASVVAADPSINVQTRSGSYTLEGGEMREVAEFRFARDNAETRFLHNLPVPEANAGDPSLPMGGLTMNLQQALVRDGDGGYLGKPAGTLRAKLDAFLADSDPAHWYASFESLLFAWTGADAIAAGTMTNGLDARRAAVLEKAYGESFQKPDSDQAPYWDTVYLRLAEAMYSSLLAETKLENQFEAIDWQHNATLERRFGDLSAVVVQLDAELAADSVRGRALVIEMGRALRGLGLAQDTTYLALREHFTDDGEADLSYDFDAVGKRLTSPSDGSFSTYNAYTQAARGGILYGNGGDDVLYAGGGGRIVGGAGENVLVGDEFGQPLFAHEGNDLLDGRGGSDVLLGGAGNDTFIFRRGSGQDIVSEGGGVDTVFFGSGLTRAELTASVDANGRGLIRILGTNDALTIPIGGRFDGAQRIEYFMFGDGTILRFHDMFAPTEGDDNLFEQEGDDSVDALGGNDHVDGGAGNDILIGGAGADTLAGGTGNDVIDGGTGNDLLLGIADEVVPLTDHYYNYPSYYASRTNGNDEYRFGFGDGEDSIVDNDTSAGNSDTIALGEGVTPGDVTLFAEGSDMVVQLSSGDRITVRGQYLTDAIDAIERITFADGTVWSGDTVSAVTRLGTPGDDNLSGTLRRPVHLVGGDGNDRLVGAMRDDVLEGGDGNDQLYGNEGADAYDGGAGDDLLVEPMSTTVRSVGADVFGFGRGDGNDSIVSERLFDFWRVLQPVVVDDDVVRFEAGISADDLTVTGSNSFVNYYTNSTDIVVRIAGDPDSSLRIQGFLGGRESGYSYESSVRCFEFADGTVWNYDQILDHLQWIGTSDADTLTGGQNGEHIYGLEGDDMLSGRGGNDVVEGGEGNDILYGENGDDTLLGGEGDDRIEPGAGNDTVEGGEGDDLIGLIGAGRQFDAPHLYNLGGSAGAGDLTVLFGRGDGHDTIQVANARAGSNDTLRLKAGIAPEDIALARVHDDLVLIIADTEDGLTVRDWFQPKYSANGRTDPFRVENIVFDDGTVLDAEAIRARILIGGENNDVLQGYDDHDDLVLGNGGDDRLSGGEGDDRLSGGEGNDLLDGGSGADVYAFARGDGNDTVVTSYGGHAVEFASGTADDEVLVRNRGGDMLLTLDTGEGIRVAHNFHDSADSVRIDEVRFDDGTIWDAATLHELALEGTDGDDFIEGFDWGDDTIAGGAGDDELEGGYGDDLYLHGRGDGYDYITDRGGFDAISFGELLPFEVEFYLDGHDLFVSILDTGEEVGIGEFFIGSYLNDTIEQFLFDDGGFVLDAAEVLALTGSDAEEVIFGTPDDDELYGGDQRTLIFAGDGADHAFGGGGDDELHGGESDDSLYGDGANDTLFGEEGNDLLVGGEGDDFIEGGAGTDTILLGLGDGLDDVFADPFSGSLPVREGFEQAYDEALQELSDLDGYASEDIFWTHIWSSESDGGWASNIAPDLLDRLVNLSSNGVTAAEARLTLEDLEFWLTTPRRADNEGTNYRWLEYEARDELAELLQQEGGNYANNFWANLGWQQVPDSVHYPLLALNDEGLPKREAQAALNTLLGWLYVPMTGDDASETARYYGEAAVELEEARALAGDENYVSDFWISLDGALFTPPDLEARLLALSDGVPAEDAISTLRALEDYFLGRDSGAVQEDTIEFGPDITPEDLEIAVLDGDNGYGGGAVELAVGIHGTNDGVIISENGHGEFNATPVTDLSVRRFHFDDGTELTLQDLLDLADGRIGEQTGTSGDDDLRGSAALDVIFARSGDDIIMARGSDDEVRGQAGNDTISAGAGDDQADGGPGDDIIAGERGNDAMRGGPGNDTFAFNYGDGHDYIDAYTGTDDDVDTISFGADIAPEMVSATVDADGMLKLSVQGGDGGSIRMPWYSTEEGFSPIDPPTVRRVQFVDADGSVRVFDLAALVERRSTELSGANPDNFVALFDGTGFELTGTVTPAGSGRAVAYAQAGDLFADPYYAGGNASSDDDDVVIGSNADDDIESGGGNDVVAAGAGDDYVDGGDGDDSIDGGAGDDFLVGGKGDDTLAGGDGDDSYWFEPGDGTLTINDDAFGRGPNRLVFGDRIAPEDLELGYDGGYLVLTTWTEGDEIRISNFDFEAVFNGRAVEHYEFADGSTLTHDELVARGFHLSGTPGADAILGTEVGDVVGGIDGDDVLEGSAGNDTLDGGGGSDTYVFSLFDGDDTLVDRESDADSNVIEFGIGIDPSSVFAELYAGDLYVYYGDYGDNIRVADVQPDDALQSLPFDLMTFADGSTRSLADIFDNGLGIYGTSDADILIGTQGGDLIYGFEDADLLSGGAGDDTYYLTGGGGFDAIVDTDEGGQFNTVVFDHPDVESIDDLVMSFDRDAGTLTLRVRWAEDGVALAGFDADNPFANRMVEMFELPQGGVSFSYDELIAGGFELDGTVEADLLLGSVVYDVVRGFDGNDVIAAGTGDDVAEGGAGNDLYLFARGDGVLTIRDDISRDAENILAFGPGITLADLRNNLRFEAPDPLTGNPGVLRIGLGNGDEVRIEGFDPEEPETGAHAVESYRFDEGTQISYRDLVLNTFIVQGDTGDDLLLGTAIQDRLYGFEGEDELRAGAGNDTLTGGTGDDLLEGGEGADMYVFHRGDGNDVIADPGDNFDANFLSFDANIDPADLVFTQDGGDMVVSYTENDSVRIRDWNPDLPAIRELRFGDITTTLAGLQNLQPYAVGSLADQSALEDAAFSYQLPADVFADPEAGGLSYYASLADGGNAGYALPSWLAFDPAARTFYGTPENPDVGGIDILVTAADEFGVAASQALHLSVINTNDAPALVAPVADVEATEDLPFSLTLPAGTFADIDAGDIVSLGVSLANGDPLPAWLVFDATTRTLSGTPGNAEVGTVELRIVATDRDGASASDVFSIAAANTNDDPGVVSPIADQSAIEDQAFVFAVPPGTFADADMGDAQFTFASLANGDPLPAWLGYDPDTQTFAGTPLNEDVGAFSVTVTAVDSTGASASDSFDFAVANSNDAPEIGFAEIDVLIGEDNGLPASALRAAEGSLLFADVDVGDVHDVQVGTHNSGYLGVFSAQLLVDSTGASGTDGGANGAAQWLFSVDNGALDSLGEGETRAQSYEVLVDDGHGGVDARAVTVTLAGVNDAPLLSAPIADQNAAAGTAFSFSFVAGAFTDIDAGDSLSYSASLSDGSALPSWLSFNAATRTFSGTPPGSTGGGTASEAFNLRVTATDTAGASAQDTFVLNIAGGSSDGIVPIVGTDHDDVIPGTAGNDVIDGRKGYDRMSGGAGDDVYYVDRTGSKVDLVTEGAVAGYDTVYSSASYTLGANVEELHLIGDDDLDGKGNSLANMVIGNAGDNKLSGEAGNDLLLDDEGDDRLDGGAGDDVLDGGAGDDTLLGGTGNDLFVHTAGGGDDVVQDSGGADAIRFGTGITAGNVAVRRSDNDLLLRLSGGNGSVTVKDWFASSAKRVEQVQFADGTVWNESAIRARLTAGGHGHGGHGGSQGDHNGYCDDRPRAQGNGHDRDNDGYDGHHGGRHGHKDHHDMRDAIAQRLKRNPDYDFTALSQYLQRNGGGGYGAMTAQQIAQRWLQVQNCVGSLAQADDHDGHGGHGGGHHDGGHGSDDGRPDGGPGTGWGHGGSTGRNRGCGGMEGFSGLGEGFRRL